MPCARDCCPVLFATPNGVGVAHAGWRGVAQSVVPNTVRHLIAATHCSVDQIVVLIGPTIASASYEVGPEVVSGICASGVPKDAFVCSSNDSLHVDIAAAVEFQLRAMGVCHIANVQRDTRADSRLHSYRRDGSQSGPRRCDCLEGVTCVSFHYSANARGLWGISNRN